VSHRQHNIADESGVRVMAERCPTCIFRPGNKMSLRPGRLRSMIEECRQKEGNVVCHETLELPRQAICRGSFEAYQPPLVQVAGRLGYLVEVSSPDSSS